MAVFLQAQLDISLETEWRLQGPVVGTTRSIGFNPRDDRIVALAHHREVDEALKNALDVGMWWHPHGAA